MHSILENFSFVFATSIQFFCTSIVYFKQDLLKPGVQYAVDFVDIGQKTQKAYVDFKGWVLL